MNNHFPKAPKNPPPATPLREGDLVIVRQPLWCRGKIAVVDVIDGKTIGIILDGERYGVTAADVVKVRR